MTSVDITKTDVSEVNIKSAPIEIVIDGKHLDLSKVKSLRIDFDCQGLEVCVSAFGGEFPYKENLKLEECQIKSQEVANLTEKDIKLKIIEKAEVMAKEIYRGKDIVITKAPSDISVKKITVQKA